MAGENEEEVKTVNEQEQQEAATGAAETVSKQEEAKEDDQAASAEEAAPETVEQEIDCRGPASISSETGDVTYSGCGGENCVVCNGSGKEHVTVPADQVADGVATAEPAAVDPASMPIPEKTSEPDPFAAVPGCVIRLRHEDAPLDPEERDQTLRDILAAEKRAFDLDAEISALKKSYKARIDTEQAAIHDLCDKLRASGERERTVRDLFFWDLGKVVTVDAMTGQKISERDLTEDDQPMAEDQSANFRDLPEEYRRLVMPEGAESEAQPADETETEAGAPEGESTKGPDQFDEMTRDTLLGYVSTRFPDFAPLDDKTDEEIRDAIRAQLWAESTDSEPAADITTDADIDKEEEAAATAEASQKAE